jgi:hypothetical protein
VAAKSGKIADGKDNIDAAILAKNEIVDPSDGLGFFSLTTGFSLSASAR